MLTPYSNSMSNNSYSNDRGGAIEEYAGDPASGGFFHADFKKHDDLKEMLDSNKDSLKLEAMKRIIGMLAKGRDASVLFPAVVKNVVSKNIEVKKLVYVYLERYAEEQQDLALLSIATFQRALKEPNQLIRAGALRVLSSVRVKMISPIVMLAIRDASLDMSPYVRKTAAHAIPKLYNLDPELKPELVKIIQKLLEDRTVLVIGSAVMAFQEVCPERVDLIHQIYRKLCALLGDVDEWGQVTIVNILTRYARSQFADPNLHDTGKESEKDFYDSGSDASDKPVPSLDPDHRLLLRSTKPLLQSRNAAVVMAVAQLYHHAAPKSEITLAARALVRLLRSHVEVQCVVLNAIAAISVKNKTMFEVFLKSFFVRTSDPTAVKLLKLEILTNLTTDSNVSVILRELQTYISHSDKQFVAATIQAIGRCACSISEVTDSCLNGLVSLLSNRDEAVVAESVVVIKRLLQNQAADPKEIVTQMARLLDSITVAQARAAILWLLGEHSQKVPTIAPDVLRKMAKTFPDENDIVKLQMMNLAVKLYITNPEQTGLLGQYIFNLARYDQNYDIRDRARVLRQFVTGKEGVIKSKAARIFLASKPAPLLQNNLKDHEEFILGSLAHYVKQKTNGYDPLPSFPENPPPADLRNVEVEPTYEENVANKKTDEKGQRKFNWLSEESDSARDSSSSSSSYDSSEDSTESKDEDDKESSSEEESSEDEESEKNTDSEDSKSDSEDVEIDDKPSESKQFSNSKNPPKSNLDLLLDLSDIGTTAPVMAPSMSDYSNQILESQLQVVQPVSLNNKSMELLDRINGKGLAAEYRFTRTPNLYSTKMANLNITFRNNSNEDVTDIKLVAKSLPAGMHMQDFGCISKLQPNFSLPVTIGINFNDTTQAINFEIVCSLGNFSVCIKPTIGELLKPVKMSKTLFIEKQSKLCGMTEHTATIKKFPPNFIELIHEKTNLGPCISDDNCFRFAGQTLSSSSLTLVTVHKNEKVVLTVNCENVVFGSVMLNELTHCLNL